MQEHKTFINNTAIYTRCYNDINTDLKISTIYMIIQCIQI